jgi:serine/threonine-protein kinase
MKEGQTVGPFVIEKALGSGAMGTVYRARHTKTGRRVALKVIAAGLTDNAGSRLRFEREAEILKQLNHPNIVRYYGARLNDDPPYYAMEYVEGESLDRKMERRRTEGRGMEAHGRITWEELVALGQQLCSALQHAHEKGIIHRDLKPSNLMVLPDGTIKLTDFGIAKDLDRTALTNDHCTVGTASYMSPEQCRGDRDLKPRSDLYSLGVVFYELLTGRKPFQAETPMDMFLQHINGTFEPPSRIVLDTPKWLDTLICGMLEKKPEHRPRDAEMVGQVLAQVAEKVAAQQSAGADLARARAIDRPRGAPRLDDTDKEAIRTLRHAVTGKKVRKRRKAPRWYVWAQAAGLIALLLAGAGILYWTLQPPSAESLYARAEKLMKSSDPEDRQKANGIDGPLTQYFRYYGSRTDAQSQQMRAWADERGVEDRRELLKRLVAGHQGKTFIKVEPQDDVERLALNAAVAEDAGDLRKAHQLWQEVEKHEQDPAGRPWALLAKNEHLPPIKGAEYLATRVEAALKADRDFEPLNDDEQPVVAAVRRARGADPVKARECWQDLREKCKDDPGRRALLLLAADQLFKLKKGDTPAPEKKPDQKS